MSFRPALAATSLLAVVGLTLLAWSWSGDGEPRDGTSRVPAAHSLLRPGVTAHAVRVPGVRRRARAAFRSRLGRQGLLQVDAQTGGVRSIARLDGLLTSPRKGDAAKIVLGYVGRHRRVFGLDADDLAGLHLVDRDRSGRLTHLLWRQDVHGVPLVDADLRATVTRTGRIVAVGGGAVPDAMGRAPSVTPVVGVRRAMALAAAATGGRHVPSPIRRTTHTAERETRFRNGDEASLVLTSVTGGLRLAWHVIRHVSGRVVYDQLVDAHDGEELQRFNRVAAITGKVFDAWPGAPVGGTQRVVDLTARLGPAGDELKGDTAWVFADVDGDETEDAGEEIRPSGGNYEYSRYGFSAGGCPALGCSWQSGVPNSWKVNREQSGTQLFALLGEYHDYLAGAPFNFDEFRAFDPVVGRVLTGAAAGAGLPPVAQMNNAYMYTPKDGDTPVMEMDLYGGSRVSNNAADDASVVFHEYSHGLNARTIKDATGWGRLGLRQSGALDEGLADYLAADRLTQNGAFVDTASPGEIRLGQHITIGRTMPTDCPVSAAVACVRRDGSPNGYTFADFGSVIPSGYERHADGEIITQTLWELRDRLVADEGEAAGVGDLRELLIEGMRGVGIEPSFLDLRNAMLQADQAVFGGIFADAIWTVFAGRGMGWYASAVDADDSRPVADFSLPPGLADGAVQGTVTDRSSGEPLAGAEVTLNGHDTHDGYVRDLRAKTDAQGRFSIVQVPAGDYPHLTVDLSGFEPKLLGPVTVASGGPAELSVGLRRNWADTRGGATLAAFTGPDMGGNNCGPAQAVDGDRTTGWITSVVGDPSITIELPRAVRVTSFGIDPTPRASLQCGPGNETEVGELAIAVAAEGESTFHDIAHTTFGPASAHRINEVRPAAPLEDVRRVRLRLIAPQSGPTVSMSELLVFATRQRAPRAAFSIGSLTPDVTESIALDASPSRPGSAELVRYAWDLDDDGHYEVSKSTPTTSVTFADGGQHRIGLMVTDADGQTDEVHRSVVVGTGAEISDLGTEEPGDAGFSRAFGVSPDGTVFGESTDGDGLGSPAWYRHDGPHAGDMQALPTIGARNRGYAYDANDAGQVVGHVWTAPGGDGQAVLWQDGAAQGLDGLGGTESGALAINRLGVIGGFAEDAGGRMLPFLKHSTSAMADVQDLGGVPEAQRLPGVVKKLNDHGVAVGCLGPDQGHCWEAFRYDDATHTFTKLMRTGQHAAALDVNEQGVAVGGQYDFASTLHAVTWSAAGLQTELPELGGATSEAMQINAGGSIVGEAATFTGAQHAVRWRNGAVEDLNAKVAGTGWELAGARGINDREEIVGVGYKDGRQHAYLLNLGPCRVCIKHAHFEEHDVPTGAWQDVGADGTVDGNRVRLVAEVQNDDTQPHLFQLAARDETAGHDLPAAGTKETLQPGETKQVSLEFDTEGEAWGKNGSPQGEHVIRLQARIGHTTFATRGAVLTIRPKPLVLLHDVMGDPSQWDGVKTYVEAAHPSWEAFAVGDRPLLGSLDTGRWDDLDGHTGSIAANARALQVYVQAIRAEGDAERVDIVGHGMGGLIARRWIQDDMTPPAAGAPPTAAHLLQLGTPNAGTPCAELQPFDAWLELRRDSVAIFNQEVVDRRAVPFAAFAGTALPSTCFTGEPGDGLVAASSATAQVDDQQQAVAAHAELPTAGAVFQTFVLPRLNGTRRVPAPAPQRLRAAAAAATEPAEVVDRAQQLLAERRASLAAGASVDLAFDVDGGSRLELSLAAAPTVGAQLVAPDGTVTAAIAAGTRGARAPFRDLAADAPAAGRWLLRVINTGDRATGVAAAARVDEDPWRLDLRFGLAPAGGGVPITAAVAHGTRRVRGAIVRVGVRRRGEGEQLISLHDDGTGGDAREGDGCYSAVADVAQGAQLVTVRAGAGSTERLLRTLVRIPAPEGGGQAVTCPRLAGGNGEIAFAGSDPASGKRAWTILGAGGSEAAFARLPAEASGAAYSLDGSQVAWTAGDAVLVADVAGGDARRLAGGDGIARSDVAWSSDAAKLAYSTHCAGGPGSSDRPAGCGIAVLDVATLDEDEILTSGVPLDGGEPSWSASGRRIAFSRRDPDDQVCFEAVACPPPTNIATVRIDGSGLHRVTRGARGDAEPAWSPSEDRIAFSRYDAVNRERGDASDRDVYVVDADGARPRRLTDDGSCDPAVERCRVDDEDSSPAWSPDGRRIVYVSARGEPVDPRAGAPLTSQLWEVRPDGLGTRALTSSATSKVEPAWRALPYRLDAAPPTCTDLAVTTAADVPVRVVLDCADPNGDLLELHVVDRPQHGELSAPAADGTVRYTPPSGWSGTTHFTYRASDGTASSTDATVTLDVQTPPPVSTPSPAPPPPMHGGGQSGSGGGQAPPAGTPRGHPVPLPGDCVVDPRTGRCIIQIGCPPLGDSTSCSAGIREVPASKAARVRAAGVPAVRVARRAPLLRSSRVHIRAGQTRRVGLRLTPRAQALLRRQGMLRIRVRVELRAGSHVLGTTVRTVRFRVRGSRQRRR